MRKFTLLLALFGFLAAGFSQAQDLKGDGQVFYSTTFDWANPDDPRGWSLPDDFTLIDNTDWGFNWHWWPNDSLVSNWTKEPPFQSTSKEDGHLCLFLDFYNMLQGTENNVDNSIQFPVMDCSTHSSVVVEFETHMMNYSTGWEMLLEVSNDAGVHWAAFDCGYGLGHKERPEDKAPGKPALFQANISEVAAGMSEVYLRLTWRGTRLYFWLIDDFKLKEAWNNNLQMKHWVAGWDDGDPDTNESVSYQMPKIFLGGAFEGFQSSVFNFGEMDQNGTKLEVSVTKNNAVVWSANHVTTDPWLSPLFIDTVNIEETYSPTDYGHYKVTYTWLQDEEEQTPEDNTRSFFFNVTDSVYSRADDTPDLYWMYGFEAYGDGYGEEWWNIDHFAGEFFPIYADCEVEGVAVYIMGGKANDSIDFRYSLFWEPPAEEDPEGLGAIEWLTSETQILDSAMFNQWLYLPFEKDGESEFLMAGDMVYAGVTYSNYSYDKFDRRNKNLAIGVDASSPKRDARSVGRRGFDAEWDGATWLKNRNLMVKLYINNHDNRVDNVDLTTAASSLDQNYPNPFNHSTEISYELGAAQEVTIEVKDMTGRTVMSVDRGYQAAGVHSYTLNASSLESGIYFYTLKAGQLEETKRMIVSR